MIKKNAEFGNKLRLVRERKNMTLKDVAAEAGVSESLISQIERNRVSPSIDTLIAIANTLNIDLEYLFKDLKHDNTVSIVKPADRNRLIQNGVDYQQLSFIPETGINPSVEAFYIDIPPGKEKGDLEFGHPGRELGTIIEGEGELLYGTSTYRLEAGDTLSFSSDIPHSIKNTGKTMMKAMWIITPGRIFVKD
ncbi:MAG: helix-turn-helix domain-containing protein [Spirochaetales bacterium]|uniref:Helix-turn-helix domain-containing protein n=1 Tax=Candidatus Thalassospirochaeta sargassi TaxID=3119039 RepID=A0AAJ1IHX9_9SPIO|nr:helix-turn-helix domain-containing protein [Spirochaetales bacterium]